MPARAHLLCVPQGGKGRSSAHPLKLKRGFECPVERCRKLDVTVARADGLVADARRSPDSPTTPPENVSKCQSGKDSARHGRASRQLVERPTVDPRLRTEPL